MDDTRTRTLRKRPSEGRPTGLALACPLVVAAALSTTAAFAPRALAEEAEPPADDDPPALSAEAAEGGLEEAHRATKAAPVNLNFVDADLSELVRAVALATGKRFIIGPKVRAAKASIFSPGPVSGAEAYQAFLSVLASSGMTVVQAGRFYKIVESDEARTAPIPLCAEGEDCPAGDRMVTRLHRLRHAGVEEVGQVLSGLVSEAGTVTAYAPTGTLIITDYGRNIRRLLRIVQELDVPSSEAHLWVEPVHHASAQDLVELLDGIFGGGEGAPAKASTPAPRARRKGAPAEAADARPEARTVGASAETERPRMILADERTNQLIIVGSEGAYLAVIRLLGVLDVPIGEGGGQARVHRLRNADAEELAKTLQALGAAESRGPAKRGRDKAGEGSAASLFEGDVRITADKATNSLLIMGSERDYASLREMIEQLDVERQQVFVEAVIIEVGLLGTKRLGVAFHGGRSDEVTAGDVSGPMTSLFGTAFDSGSLQSLALDASALQGLALGIQGPSTGLDLSDVIPGMPAGLTLPSFGIVLQALQTSSDVNVLSTPHVLAIDNEPAELDVGQNVPVSTSFMPGLSQAASLLAGGDDASSAASSLFSGVSIGRQDVGVKLGITPHVNQADQVRLEVELEVSEVTSEDAALPRIGQRILKTSCIVADQQTVVLGGLVSDKVVEGVEKVPFLGDIPVLGKLFSRRSRTTEKRNLLVFLTPTIVRDSSDFRRIFAQKMQERREFIDRYTAFQYHEVQPEIDYERTSGLLEEIRRTVVSLEEAEARAALLEAVEEPVHEPRPPLDLAPGEELLGGEVPPGGEEVLAGAEPPPGAGP